MSRHAWSGVIPILATPFNAEGGLDLGSLESLVEFALRSGASGVAVNGMASEWFCLSRAERQQIVNVVAGALPPESLFVVGAHGHSATQLAEEISGLPRRDRIDAVIGDATRLRPVCGDRASPVLLSDCQRRRSARHGAGRLRCEWGQHSRTGSP